MEPYLDPLNAVWDTRQRIILEDTGGAFHEPDTRDMRQSLYEEYIDCEGVT